MSDFGFKTRKAYIERSNDQRMLNDVLKKRQERSFEDLHDKDLKGNNMRFQNMRKDTQSFNDNLRSNTNLNFKRF